MKNDWLSASNFERMHQLLAAINLISVHIKLRIVGVDDGTDDGELSQARKELIDFLNEFASLLQEVERNQDLVVVGHDPRLGELTIHYMSERRRGAKSKSLYMVSLPVLVAMLESETETELPQLTAYLTELRTLLDQHSQADVRDILGDI